MSSGATLLGNTIEADPVPEVRTMGRTLARWRTA